MGIGYGLKVIKESLSGWEKSHFGGFYRMIQDYPYIKLDYDVKITTPEKLNRDLGWYTSEKLIKLYLIKLNALTLIKYIKFEVITQTNPLTGIESKFQLCKLDDLTLLERVMDGFPEYAPLFEHYQNSILETMIIKPIKNDDQNQGEGDGEEDKEKENKSEDALDEDKGKGSMMDNELGKALEGIIEQAPYNRNSLSGFEGTPKFIPINSKDHKEYKFTQKEIMNAENLVKQLDISFEPKSDVIKSLRSGKIDTCKLAEVLAGSTSIYKQTVEEQDTRPFTVCVLADLSGSMLHDNRLPMQLEVMNSLYLALSSILPEDKLWIYGHTGDDSVDIYPFCTPYDTDYAGKIPAYHKIEKEQNYDGIVIEQIHKKIRETTDDRVILLMLSDGQPSGNNYGNADDIVDMKRILEKARRDEFVTVGIGIQYVSEPDLYTYNKVVIDLSTLVKDVSNVVNKVVKAEFQ
jgi:hypothetical protein